MPQPRPLIGITMRIDYAIDRFYLSRYYCEAVAAAGGDPLLIPLIPEPGYLDSLCQRLDGLVLPGSDSDMDPMIYGRQPHPQLGSVHPIKDSTDLGVLARAEESGLPIFAICFGMQSLNVSRGGTLVQDIPSQLPQAINHQQGVPRDRRSHAISIESGSKTHRLAEGGKALVNSHHHQAVETVGTNLVATAWATDGIIEGIEDPRDSRWVVGVQWHPELDWKDEPLSKRLFNAFVNAASERKSSAVQGELVR